MDKTQIFLLHFAGGNCYSFNFLKPFFGSELEFIPLELPGRGKRISEDLLRQKEFAILDYLRQIKTLRNKQPFLIYGHSMGAKLGLEVAKRMEASGDAPSRLVVSGSAGPGVGENKKRFLMSKIDFIAELKKLGGIPNEVFDNNELFDFLLPILRSDFEIIENEDEPAVMDNLSVSVPISAIMGSEEQQMSRIDNWQNFTSNEVVTSILPGDHFFIQQHPKELSELILSRHD